MNAHVQVPVVPATDEGLSISPLQAEFDREYSPIQQLCYELRVLLALAHLDELAGPDQTHMRNYQQDKVGVLLERVEACQR